MTLGIDNKLESYSKLLSKLIATPSASSTNEAFDESNEAVVDLLADWCERLGMSVEVLDVPVPKNTKVKKNLIATLGEGPGGLVFSGHTDTVPVNEVHWQSDPYQLIEKNNKLYGIGATDMKGFFPVALKAIESMHLTAEKLKSPLILLATADEESGMAGAKAILDAQKPKATYAIIGEPTNLKPIISHKGVLMESIKLIGKSGHSSDPNLGVNALDGMSWVLQQLMIWREELKAEHLDGRFHIPYPTLNLGCIHGGEGANKICEACELHIDLRFLPNMRLDHIRQELSQRLKAIETKLPGIKLEIRPLFAGLPAFEPNSENEHALAFNQTLEKLTKHSSEHVAFGTEAPYLQQLGMNPIIMGPGNIDQAHKANEYISMEQINPAIEILRQLIDRYCL